MKKLSLILLKLHFILPLSGQVFTDITQQAGLNISMGMGDVAVWIDHNNNGWLDFFYSSNNQTLFYQNNGDGTFTDISAQSGLIGSMPYSVAVGDFDNDGYTDLLISSIHTSDPLKIFRNDSGNGFTEVYAAPFGCKRAIWIDYNGNGLVDIFCNTWSAEARLLKNIGNGSFTDVSASMNFNPSSGSTAAAADFNNTGLQDIYTTSESTTATNRLYSNMAAHTYTDATFSAFVMDYRRGVAQAWGDFNNNGWMDLYVSNLSSNRNIFFQNNGNGTFTENAIAAGIQDVGDARTCAWLDVNNNGLLDLFTTNHVNPNRLYINNGDETFNNMANEAGIAGPQDGFAISWGDFDRDGDLDVLVAGHSYGLALLRNDGGNTQNYLNITLAGDYDNKSGIGSRITVYTDTLMQIREVNGGRGSVSQDALSQHFGLADRMIVDSIHIRWPSGMLQKEYNIAANQFITINQQGNVPPSFFHLVEPVPDSIYGSDEVLFTWTKSYDPDSGNIIDYYLHLGNPFFDTILGPTQDTFMLVNTKQWMERDSTFWHIEASDGTDIRLSWERWEFLYSQTTDIDQILTFPDKDLIIQSMSPIPAKNLLHVDIEVETSVILTIALHHVSGSFIKEFDTHHLLKGNHLIVIENLNVKRGIYLLTFRTGKQTITKKVVFY